MSSEFLYGYWHFYVSEIMLLWEKKNDFDNIEIEMSTPQQRASITSTALTIRLWQLSAVGGIYKMNTVQLLMQKLCDGNALMLF